MSWSKPFSDVEIAYIEKSWPKVGCAAIARKLGRSTRGVENVVNRLGLRERRAQARSGEETRARGEPQPAPEPAPAPAESGGPERQDELADLRELKRMLRRTLKDDIDPRSVPKLSAEYREVLKRIGELEGGDDGGPVAGEGGNLLVSIPLRSA